MRYTALTFASLLTALNALTITYPSTGVSVDPSRSVAIKWTSTSSDPSTINLVFTNNGAQQVLASNVQTSSGTYTLPANTIVTYGSGFTISAQSSGNTVATSGTFILSYSGVVSTNSNGGLSLVATGAAATSTSASSGTVQTTSLGGQSATMTSVSGTSSDTAVVSTSVSNSTSRAFTTHGIQSFSGTLISSSVSGSATSSVASSATSAASTQNAQPRIVVGKEVMSIAGFLAGLVALVV